MDRNRLMMIAAVLAAVVVVAGGFLLGIQPQLKAASTAQATETTVVSQNASLATNLTTLRNQFSKLDSLQSQLGLLKASVPDDVASAAFITELNGVAKSAGVTLSNIDFSSAAAYAPPAAAAPATSTDSSSSTSSDASASPTATAAPTPVATTPAAPTLTTSPLITASNFSDIPVTMEIQGSYAQALTFLQGLRDGPRLFLVTSISTSQDSTSSDSGEPSWNIGGLIFALTDAASAQQAEQTQTSTAAGSTSGSSSTDTAAGK